MCLVRRFLRCISLKSQNSNRRGRCCQLLACLACCLVFTILHHAPSHSLAAPALPLTVGCARVVMALRIRLQGIGVLMTSILTILTPLAASKGSGVLIAVRVLEGLFEGVTFPAFHAVLGLWVPLHERTKYSTLAYSGAQFGTVVRGKKKRKTSHHSLHPFSLALSLPRSPPVSACADVCICDDVAHCRYRTQYRAISARWTAQAASRISWAGGRPYSTCAAGSGWHGTCSSC